MFGAHNSQSAYQSMEDNTMAIKLPELHFEPRLKVIDKNQIRQIHTASLEVLERVGVKMTHPRGVELLAGAGAKVEGDRVRIPAWMVEDAIRKAPSRVVLGKRSGQRSVWIEAGKTWFGPSLDCIDYLDPLTDERSRFTSEHCRISATIADAMPNFDWSMIIGMADDQPPDIADRVIVRQALTYCEKPLVLCCKDVNSARDIYEMALLICGGKENLNRAPTIVQYSEPISPLEYYDPAVEKMLFTVENGIPLINFPAPQACGSAPATFAGHQGRKMCFKLRLGMRVWMSRSNRLPSPHMRSATPSTIVRRRFSARQDMRCQGAVPNRSRGRISRPTTSSSP